MTHRERRKKILQAALKVARAGSYRTITREQVARAAKVSPGLVQYHFNSMDKFREDLVRFAIQTRYLPVIAQALGALEPAALDAPRKLREQALEFIATKGA